MVPIVMAALAFLGKAAATAAAAKGIDMAIPKKGIIPTQDIPGGNNMDLNSLLAKPQQSQSQLPQQNLQLSNRLPRSY